MTTPATTNPFRHTKIVFTIGPASEPDVVLEELILTGVDVCRINMAHATPEWTREIIRNVRRVGEKAGRQIAVMMDIKGPEIRTGEVAKTIELQAGDLFDLFIDPAAERDPVIIGTSVNYPGFIDDVAIGATILIDNGLIRMEVVEKTSARVRCRVIIPGPLGNRRHINLPGQKINLPALTQKDLRDLAVGIEEEVDFFALSFVREPDDLDLLRRHIADRGGEARIIAKIEDQTAISNLEDIIRASDGLMVARGDLGIEMPFEQLPIIQRRAVECCLRLGRPVIIATHMLESMIHSPVPTRAEITDVANAVHEFADAVMLSGETTIGKYPGECVRVLNRVIDAIEGTWDGFHNQTVRLRSPKAKMLRSAVVLGEELNGAGIIVFTRSGHLARVLAALRPQKSPVYAFTDVPHLFRQLLLYWGIEPFFMEFRDNPNDTIADAFNYLKKRHWMQDGDPVVVITNALEDDRIIDTIQYRTVK